MPNATQFEPVSKRRLLLILSTSTALASSGGAWAQTSNNQAPGPTQASAVGEIIVTANKRAENIQSVPMSVAALGQATLAQHQVQSMDDYIKLMPSISFQSFGPGQSNIYFRGITTGIGPVQTLPTSSIYVDEAPLTSLTNTPDLHIYDVSRVEALAGPQGTLFGASSLSGTLHIVTNKPEIGQFSAGYDLEGNKFGDGAGGGEAQGFVNLPVNDQIALRFVAFYDHEGGYINNILGTRTYERPHTLPDGTVADAPMTINNAQFAKNNFNDVTTYGGRAALKFDLNSEWTVEPSVIYQHQTADGTFLYDPRVGDLDVHDFTPDHNTDDWYLASLTVLGKISSWDVTFAGSYFERTTDTVQDYSYYSVAYDSLTDYNFLRDAQGNDINPTQIYRNYELDTKQSDELRFSSPSSSRLKLTAGLFYEHQTSAIRRDFEIPGLQNAVNPFSPPIPGAPDDDVFYTTLKRIDNDYAIFADASYDILPNLTVLGGIRGFNTGNSTAGFVGGLQALQAETSCVAQTVQACPNVGRSYNQSGETHRLGLKWQVAPGKMVYFTYSTGFRPGGTNFNIVALGQQLAVPNFAADTVTNYEVGAKTSWLDDKLVANGALFWEEWDSIQYLLPGPLAIYYTVNAGNAYSRGVEGNVTFRPVTGLTLSASGTLLDARLETAFGNLAPKGTHLPLTPGFNINATARYDFTTGRWDDFIQAGVFHQNSATQDLVQAQEAIIGPTAGFTTFDFSAGTSFRKTRISAYIQNAFDERGILSKNSVCAPVVCGAFARSYPIKPQLFGLRLGQKF